MNPFPDFDLKGAAERFNHENEIENNLIAERRSDALREARVLADKLSQADPRLMKVYGFGSTFMETMPYRLDSDIDLAFEGGDFFSLLRVVAASSFPVDLLDINGRTDEFAELIRRNGVVLFTKEEEKGLRKTTKARRHE